MILHDLCSTTRDAVHEIFDNAQEQKAQRTDLSSAYMSDEALDSIVAEHTNLQEQNARRIGCGIKFIVDADSVRETCGSSDCPLSLDSPESV